MSHASTGRAAVARGLRLGLTATLLAAGCGDAAPEPPPRARGVVLVTLDGLRPDAIGAGGAEAAATPALDGFAAGAVAFADALTPAPLLLPAHASLLTGLDPRRHGARDDHAAPVSAGVRTLAEILVDDGFRARAAVSSAALAPGGGLERGFERYDAPAPSDAMLRVGFAERRAEATVDRAIADLTELRRGDAPFLYLVQLGEPRAPFTPLDVPADAPAAARYAGEVRAADRELGRLLAAFEPEGLADELVVIVTAPRATPRALLAPGEGAAPGVPHAGDGLDEDELHVPLLLRAPGLAPGVVRGPVSLVDVAPTALALLGVPPPGELDGRSLLPAIERGAAEPGRVVAVESWHPWLAHGAPPLAGVIRDDLRLVRGAETSLVARDAEPPVELFRPQDARSKGMLAALEERFGPADRAWEADPEAVRAHLARLAEAEALLAAGASGPARELLAGLVREAPLDPTAARLFASILLAPSPPTQADVARVEPLLERALERRPDDPRLHELLARCAAARAVALRRAVVIAERQGELEAAEEGARRLAELRARRIEALERALARLPGSEGLRRELENARR